MKRNTAITILLFLLCLPIISGLRLFMMQTTTLDSGEVTESEIRGVFIHESIFGYAHDWNVIAETLASYDINMVVVNDFRIFSQRPYNEIRAAIDAFHSKGIAYHSLMLTIAQSKNNADPSSTAARTHTGAIYSEWQQDPILVRDYILSDVQNYLADFPDVDGIMLDYMRYIVQDMPYGDECKAAFEAWLGEGTITDWTPFYPGGSRWNEYGEWRTIPINTLVKDTHDLIKSIDSSILVSASAFPLFDDSPIYQRKWLGQDIAYWIKEDYIDFVVPMIYARYTYGANGIEDYCTACMKYWMDGQPEGKIPVVACLRVDWTTTDLTPEEFATQVNCVRSKGLDGWLIFRYGGPGDSEPNPDTRDYLDNIAFPQTFKMYDIEVETVSDIVTVSWKTTLPTTSKVEFSTDPLYSAEWSTQAGFHFWNIIRGTLTVISDSVEVTDHEVELTDLNPDTTYYFRVQSADDSGIATSYTMSFVMGNPLPPDEPPTQNTTEPVPPSIDDFEDAVEDILSGSETPAFSPSDQAMLVLFVSIIIALIIYKKSQKG